MYKPEWTTNLFKFYNAYETKYEDYDDFIRVFKSQEIIPPVFIVDEECNYDKEFIQLKYNCDRDPWISVGDFTYHANELINYIYRRYNEKYTGRYYRNFSYKVLFNDVSKIMAFRILLTELDIMKQIFEEQFYYRFSDDMINEYKYNKLGKQVNQLTDSLKYLLSIYHVFILCNKGLYDFINQDNKFSDEPNIRIAGHPTVKLDDNVPFSVQNFLEFKEPPKWEVEIVPSKVVK